MRARGGYRFFTGSGSAGVELAPGATSWTVLSDRNQKKDIRPADCQDILEKLARVPISEWRYKWEASESTAHLGPMAQDFKAAIYPGRDDTGITTLEADGVALAAIQGLNEKVESGKRRTTDRMKKLESENAELRRELQEIRQLISTLTKKGKQP
jgi:hypothetical protein